MSWRSWRRVATARPSRHAWGSRYTPRATTFRACSRRWMRTLGSKRWSGPASSGSSGSDLGRGLAPFTRSLRLQDPEPLESEGHGLVRLEKALVGALELVAPLARTGRVDHVGAEGRPSGDDRQDEDRDPDHLDGLVGQSEPRPGAGGDHIVHGHPAVVLTPDRKGVPQGAGL